MKDCIFCKIGNHEIPSKMIYEDEICLAFLDLSQTTNGHTLVIPKQHFTNFLEVDDTTLSHIMKVAKKLAHKIMNSMHATGVNILTNANESAGQTVMHFHIHIIPRYDETDDITISFTDHSKDVSLDDIYQQINT